MVAKITALGAPIALLVLVLVASGGSPAVPPTESDGADAAAGGGGRADAKAHLKDAEGNRVGVVRFWYEGDEVGVKARVNGVERSAPWTSGLH